MDATKLNYYALTVAILKNCLPETAFDLLEYGPDGKRKRLTQEDTMDMLLLKARGIPYKAIGEMYGMTKGAIFIRLKRERLAKRQPMSPEREATKDENSYMRDLLRDPEAG